VLRATHRDVGELRVTIDGRPHDVTWGGHLAAAAVRDVVEGWMKASGTHRMIGLDGRAILVNWGAVGVVTVEDL
jgi:hypothetical protein